MKFELFVVGRIKSGNASSRSQNQFDIRRQVDVQLRALWNTEPLKSADSIKHFRAFPPVNDVGIGVQRQKTIFYPLICSKLSLACKLKINFYEPEGSLSIISDVTDIDNRLKTLFDALRVPADQEIPQSHDYGKDFYCLLEEDRLIWEVNVKRTRLLRSFEKEDSLARITVSLVETDQTFANMAFAGAVVR